MYKYFDLPHTGRLEIEYVFYDLGPEPVLFVCRDKNTAHYLCGCNKLGESWIIGQTDVLAIIDLIDNKITIREVENRCGLVFEVTWNGEKFSFSESFYDGLPQTGAYLDLEGKRLSEYREVLQSNGVT